MAELKIKEENLRAAYRKGCSSSRQVLESLFPDVDFRPKIPIRRGSMFRNASGEPRVYLGTFADPGIKEMWSTGKSMYAGNFSGKHYVVMDPFSGYLTWGTTSSLQEEYEQGKLYFYTKDELKRR